MKKTHVDKNGNTWEWEVTSETEAALRALQKSIQDNLLQRPNERK